MFFSGSGSPFPGMDGPGGVPAMSKKPSDTTKFYTMLEVDKSANSDEIRKAYLRLALQHHPDKPSGDAQKFKEIKRAYEVLGDAEKRAKYDKYGEAGLNDGGGGCRRQSTKDIVHPLKVTLEQLYNGQTKKMAINREVIDKKKGVQECSACGGQGVKVEVVRVGSMSIETQSACNTCGGQGKSFKTKKDREVVEVHIQKGSPDQHKVTFREKADEHPDMDTGDVVFVLKQQEHAEFKRRGADLFIERKISLVEALCGFEMELLHLDGRKLLIKTQPGDIVKPMTQGFDPFADADSKMEWDIIEDADCPSIESVAQAETTDVDTLKKMCETQLKRKGIDVGVFVVDGNRTYFKQGTREEILAAKETKKGSTMYVISDPSTKAHLRLMKAVKGEGMPTYKNPFIHGNLFLILTVEFPDSLTPENQEAIRNLLPPPLNKTSFSVDDTEVEVHTVTDIDPLQSYNSNKANMQAGGEAYDEDEEGGGRGGGPGQGMGCQQM